MFFSLFLLACFNNESNKITPNQTSSKIQLSDEIVSDVDGNQYKIILIEGKGRSEESEKTLCSGRYVISKR